MLNMILIAYNIEILPFLDDTPCFSRAVICKLLFANFALTFFLPFILVKFCHTVEVFDMDGRGGLTVNETLKIKINIQQITGH